MAANSRFAVAAHVLSLLHIHEGGRITSEYIAGSVNTNPVVVRRIMGMLNKAGLVQTSPGVAGATLARPIDEITLLDVYRAVQPEDGSLFAIHDNPNPDCRVGRNIQVTLDTAFTRAQQAMERELAGMTMEEVCLDIVNRP
ncbi:Rrf2 family transcriptional regulator [Cohnella nanjingensis]|uniref:Rrf2 family transcriptional regulator n=1 Tax=Cohnella nanjingensis TaxID=1387779 RepID=A0A7X0VDN9_9BACL|nr:Rrf2 family transcriptional regulator [Cohnella nanjingensis]MBB6669881.1 Rrf2 family transcriptional regulator [Cohnella nanjingensis]